MPNRVFQSVIYQMKGVADRVFGVIDEDGIVIACSDHTRIGEVRAGLREEFAFATGTFVRDGYSYRVLGCATRVEYILFVEGSDKTASELAAVAAVTLNRIRELSPEKHDREGFMRNALLDNIMPTEIYSKAKEARVEADIPRTVYVIRFPDKSEAIPYDMLINLFPEKKKDTLVCIDDREVVLVREFRQGDPLQNDFFRIGESIVDTLATEFFAQVSIGIGRAAMSVADLPGAYREAVVALEVGRIFGAERRAISYENLGIGRLIYQLPGTLCEMFLKEAFKKGGIEDLDKDTLSTVLAFFDNDLNLSETARQLFVHRNTLVYRIEKVKKVTGLDVREFDQAIIFKVAMMVRRYLASRPKMRK